MNGNYLVSRLDPSSQRPRIPLAYTSFLASDGWASDRQEWMRTQTRFHTILTQFEGSGADTRRGGLTRLALHSQGELLPARLVIHPQAPMPPSLLQKGLGIDWLRVTDGPRITGARHGEAGTSERGRHASCPPSFGFRITPA